MVRKFENRKWKNKTIRKEIKFLVTGGHLTPALAVIDELKSRGYVDILWVGRKRTMRGDKALSAEYLVVRSDRGIPFVELVTGKIVRFSDLSSFFEFVINIFKIPIGLIHSFFILLKYRPSIIISFGGFLAVPIVMAGWLLRIPSVTHEQTVVTGMANKIIAKFARKICVSWKESMKFFDRSKVVLTGNPLRKEIFTSVTNNFVVNERLKTIYITGGNQGAHIINETVVPIIEKLLEKHNVIHQTGITTITRDFEACDRLSKSLSGKTKGVYIVRGSIYGTEIGEVFDKADLIISRAGANIVTEILALGKPAILIPIPWSINNEQLLNAKMLKKIGIAEIIEEKDLNTEVLFKNIEAGSKNLKKGKNFKGRSLRDTINKVKEMVNLNAAKRIVDEILKLKG